MTGHYKNLFNINVNQLYAESVITDYLGKPYTRPAI